MIVGIGTDIVEVKRFESWQQFPEERLLRVFTQYELDYCRVEPQQFNLQRLAARFAAKEAFYKAFASFRLTLGQHEDQLPFLTITPLLEVRKNILGAASIDVKWEILAQKIAKNIPVLVAHLSIAHEKEHALAFVMLELRNQVP